MATDSPEQVAAHLTWLIEFYGVDHYEVRRWLGLMET